MTIEPDSLILSLQQYGLSEDEARVYIFLQSQGETTALKMSRNLKIARTKIYRLLTKLIGKGLVTEIIEGYGTKFQAEPYEKLHLIIDEKQGELQILKENAPNLFNQLAALSIQTSEELKVLHYRGVEGLKQVSWNSTKVEGVFRIYEIDLMHSVVDTKFAEKCRKEFASKPQNIFKQLTNAKMFDDYTKITGHVDQWEPRHISKEKLDIQFEIQMYNNVTCMFEYSERDIFIVEIYNQKLADMQKQIFDLIWEAATPMKIISPYGAAKLV